MDWQWLVTAIIGASGIWLGHILRGRSAKREADTTRMAAQSAATAALIAAESARDNSLTDQLQEELARYRKATDERLDKLEAENAAYRRYVFALIDHGDAGGLERLPWPNELPR